MNIVITLPTKLARLIYEGAKTIEVRKSFPMDFNPKEDVVYICEKGTGLVTGMFTIDAKGTSNSPQLVWEKHKQSICIDERWFYNYLKGYKKFYLWHIHVSMRFQKQYPLQKYFNVKKAPQSYVYTSTNWFLNDDFSIEVEEPQETLISEGMCSIEKAVQ